VAHADTSVVLVDWPVVAGAGSDRIVDAADRTARTMFW
jgi:hypothetical protein